MTGWRAQGVFPASVFPCVLLANVWDCRKRKVQHWLGCFVCRSCHLFLASCASGVRKLRSGYRTEHPRGRPCAIGSPNHDLEQRGGSVQLPSSCVRAVLDCPGGLLTCGPCPLPPSPDLDCLSRFLPPTPVPAFAGEFVSRSNLKPL